MVLVRLICIGRRVNVVSMKFVKTGALYLARGGLVLERFVLDGLDCSFGWSRVLLVDQSQFRLDDVPKVWLLVRNTKSSHKMSRCTILSPVLFLLPSWKKYCQMGFRKEWMIMRMSFGMWLCCVELSCFIHQYVASQWYQSIWFRNWRLH